MSSARHRAGPQPQAPPHLQRSVVCAGALDAAAAAQQFLEFAAGDKGFSGVAAAQQLAADIDVGHSALRRAALQLLVQLRWEGTRGVSVGGR